jgi:methyl-accepting chemotaxis protein
MTAPTPPRRPFQIGLTAKLLGTSVLVVVGVALAMSSRATAQLDDNLDESFESKGEAIALSLAAATEQSVGSSLTTIQGAIDSNKVIAGVKYIYAEDADGVVYVHTFSPTFPTGLDQLNDIALGEEIAGRVKIQRIDMDSAAGRVRAIDVAAPAASGALGTVHVGMDPEVIESRVATLRNEMVLWGGVMAAAGIVLLLFITLSTVITPIRKLTEVTSEIVAKGDLTQKIGVSSRDEIGQLALTFSQMVDKLKEIPTNLRESTQLLTQSVASLSQSATDQSSTMSRQAVALQETQVTVQEIKQTSLLAAQKAETVLRVAERAEEIGRQGESAIEQSLGGLTEIRSQVDEIANKISQLAERTRQIGLITETVKDLADQSNMLALNAAIEAVRSGEHGKGFAVVAREIRSLADQSIQATNRVREILDDIAAAIRTAVSITERGAQKMEGGLVQIKSSGESLRELSNIVRENSAAVRQIAAAVSQQNAGVTQIFTAVNDLNTLMSDTVKRLEATTKSVDVLNDVSQKVTQVVQSFRV